MGSFKATKLDVCSKCIKQNKAFELTEAIQICDQHTPFAAGAFRGELAVELTKQGKIQRAKELLETGESQVQEFMEQYAQFLCHKSMVLFYGHDWNVLRTTLLQTEQLCTKLQIHTNDPLRQQYCL